MSRERFQARSKKVQKLGRDGLVEQARATGEEQRVSQRTADVSFGRERPPERDAAQQVKERGKKARLRAQIAEYQQPSVPADTPERTEAPSAPEVPASEQTAIERTADDVPLTRAAPDDGKTVTARHKRQIKAAARQRDAPRRLSFEQPENGALRFEPERGAEHESGQPEKEPRCEARHIPRRAEKPLAPAPRREVEPRSSAERGQESQTERHHPKQKVRYQTDAPRRLSFEQPKDGVMQFEPSRGITPEQKHPEETAYTEDASEETPQAAQTVMRRFHATPRAIPFRAARRAGIFSARRTASPFPAMPPAEQNRNRRAMLCAKIGSGASRSVGKHPCRRIRRRRNSGRRCSTPPKPPRPSAAACGSRTRRKRNPLRPLNSRANRSGTTRRARPTKRRPPSRAVTPTSARAPEMRSSRAAACGLRRKRQRKRARFCPSPATRRGQRC